MNLIAQFGLFNGILVLIFIFAYSFYRNINKIFLGFSLFFLWYSLLLFQLNATHLILEYPFLQRTGLIAGYLAFPFLFIYSRNTFYPGKLWRKSDWLLLLPALIYVIDLMPFFLMSAENKNAIWRGNLGDNKKMLLANEGWMGLSGLHFIFIHFWATIIMFFQVRLIYRNQHIKIGFKSLHNKRLLSFIIMITLLYIPFFVPGIFGVLFKLPWYNPAFGGMIYGISLTAIAIYLLIYPNLLFGFIPEKKFSYQKDEESKMELQNIQILVPPNNEKSNAIPDKVQKEEANSLEGVVSDSGLSPELEIVLEIMKRDKPFLKQGFTIQDLSTQTGIPVYQLSPFINGQFKLNFTSWVNHYRIEYFLEQAIENQNMTLEALANNAGFKSRTTFISAFKKEKGVTPSEFLKSSKLTA